jgi:hydrogenase maturation protease
VSADLETLLLQKEKSILFVGVGNVLRSDDGVGVYISSRIKNTSVISSLTVEMSIENYIGKINSLNPDILVIIDCTDLKSTSVTHKLLFVKDIEDITFNTHNISFKQLSDFFKMPVYILGIQPEKIGFGENISYLVKNVANKIIKQINKMEVHNGCRISL